MKNLKIVVAVTAIGDHLVWKDFALSVLHNYYDPLGIEIDVQTEFLFDLEKYGPSWQWLLCHEYIDADFIICQDLDLLPTTKKLNIFDYLNFDMLNFMQDCTVLNHPKGPDAHFPYFKWNCGWCGVPKSSAEYLRGVYEKYKDNPRNWDATFEQYYLNMDIGQNKIPVNEVPIKFNHFYDHGMKYDNVAFCHYTYNIKSSEKLVYMLKDHPNELRPDK